MFEEKNASCIYQVTYITPVVICSCLSAGKLLLLIKDLKLCCIKYLF